MQQRLRQWEAFRSFTSVLLRLLVSSELHRTFGSSLAGTEIISVLFMIRIKPRKANHFSASTRAWVCSEERAQWELKGDLIETSCSTESTGTGPERHISLIWTERETNGCSGKQQQETGWGWGGRGGLCVRLPRLWWQIDVSLYKCQDWNGSDHWSRRGAWSRIPITNSNNKIASLWGWGGHLWSSKETI